ncbi:hypothetical protein L202_01778 [Cryptococcus amylolentus CBS 6039]|uniref:NAD-dependent epimerase/dehydratase domain-containing protein n=2 Tax=Cryptococcus amylolentus TaxID=104669 RepID=A0A1E3I572_9TREE|nr:hypothetical protein L202_01778 [Cryptococcus amylolentus CBS 6039]ODN83682.1 hypothetical protein L202_01778 [Cryptococcus amylolentus CBS 6039]ODO11157.1 hypothetical protein I350_01760 [Cryptococcus amylolentus CBS 6273]
MVHVFIPRASGFAKTLEDRGLNVIRATLEDIDVLAKTASDADAVIHLGCKRTSPPTLHPISHLHHRAYPDPADLDIITAFGTVLSRTNKPLIITSCTLVTGIPNSHEYSPGKVPPMAASERLTLRLSSAGIRTHIIRLPPVVHGDGDTGFLAHYIECSRKAGFAGYVGDGEHRWPTAHVEDVVQVYKLALETIHLKGGNILHASHESGVFFSDIASTVAKRLNIKAKSMTKQEAEEAYTWGVQMMVQDGRTSSEWTRAWLGWKPEGVGLVEDLEGSGWYFGDDCVYRGRRNEKIRHSVQ